MRVPQIARFGQVLCFVSLSTVAWAQTGGTGAIAGVVRDTSGAVLPGVTVEAASPALIEKVRTVTSDGQGVYRLVDLRPGSYVLTVSLPGFTTVRREGLDVTAGFTATVNAELRVGTLEETVTVSGAAPVVDTQNVVQQQTLARGTLDALPTTRRAGAYASFLPGAVVANHDVGGLSGERGAQLAVHGGRLGDINMVQDGMNQTMLNNSIWSFNPHNTQEIVIQTGGTSAENMTGGVIVNIVPKEGGNTFSGSFGSSFGHRDLQSDNLTDVLRARGLGATPSVRKLYDVGGSVGGPLRQDRVWFFTGHRKWAASRYLPGNFYNTRQGTLFYEADPSRPAYTNDYYQDDNLRLTWQASAKNKLAFSYAIQNNCNCVNRIEIDTTLTPEATGQHHYQPNYIPTVSWSYPATGRLLLEAGATGMMTSVDPKRPPEVGPNDIAVLELSTNINYGSRALNLGQAGSFGTNTRRQHTERFAVSYITGSHAFKTGLHFQQYFLGHKNHANPDQIHGGRKYSFRNQLPVSVTIFSTPSGLEQTTTQGAVYAQDQWTIRKLTLNLGVRYDHLYGSVPEQHLAAGYFVPARDFPAVKNAPNFKDLSPRLGAAYDVFGTGRTAVKAFVGRYVSYTASSTVNNPVGNQAASAVRTWNDANGNFIPDCVLGPSVPGANGECGALSDRTFGQIRAGNTQLAPDALGGFQRQSFNWRGTVSVQHELRPGMALNLGYFRTWYGNFSATDNLAVTPADYDPYCIIAPADSRLPGGGGQQMCGLYDISPAKFGQVNNLITLASHYGKQTEVYNGVDITLNARFGQGGQFSGGLSAGRTVTDTCFLVDSPQQTRPGFCTVSPPWSSGTQVKFLVVYPLPWSLQTSAVYQNVPGIPITASYVATNAQIAPSLGRNLGACRGAATCNATATIDLIPPNTVFEDRFQQVDFRVTRLFRMEQARLQGSVDLYNLFNQSPVLQMLTRYGPAWLNPREILPGRLLKFAVSVDF